MLNYFSLYDIRKRIILILLCASDIWSISPVKSFCLVMHFYMWRVFCWICTAFMHFWKMSIQTCLLCSFYLWFKVFMWAKPCVPLGIACWLLIMHMQTYLYFLSDGGASCSPLEDTLVLCNTQRGLPGNFNIFPLLWLHRDCQGSGYGI